jgi:hypothetical protein
MNTEKFEGHDEGNRSSDCRAEIEEAVGEYLRGKPGTLRLLLERLCDAAEGEEAEKRPIEDWSIAKDYTHSRLRRLA